MCLEIIRITTTGKSLTMTSRPDVVWMFQCMNVSVKLMVVTSITCADLLILTFRLNLCIQRLLNKLFNCFQSCSLVPMFMFLWSPCGENPDYPEETNLPDLVLTYHLTCDTSWFDLYNEIELFVPQTHHNSYIDSNSKYVSKWQPSRVSDYMTLVWTCRETYDLTELQKVYLF